MFNKSKKLACPVCKTDLGTFDKTELILVTCPDQDCKVTWRYRINDKIPTAIDYPGKKASKKCTCSGCTK